VQQVYRVTLSILTRIFNALNLPEPASRWQQIDRSLIDSADRHTLRQAGSQQLIPLHLPISNSPAVQFSQRILGVNSSSSYLSVRLEDSKISVYSIRGVPFKLGDSILSKAIRKDS
jgi:hypothetical protein